MTGGRWYEWWTWRERLGVWLTQRVLRTLVRDSVRLRDLRGGPSLRVTLRDGSTMDLVIGQYYRLGMLSGDIAEGWLIHLSPEWVRLIGPDADYRLGVSTLQSAIVWAASDERRP